MWILLFIDWMYATSIFSVTVCVVHLNFTGFKEASSKLWKPISCTEIYVKGIELVSDTLSGFWYVQLITFDLVRRSDKQTEVLRHLSFHRYTEV